MYSHASGLPLLFLNTQAHPYILEGVVHVTPVCGYLLKNGVRNSIRIIDADRLLLSFKSGSGGFDYKSHFRFNIQIQDRQYTIEVTIQAALCSLWVKRLALSLLLRYIPYSVALNRLTHSLAPANERAEIQRIGLKKATWERETRHELRR